MFSRYQRAAVREANFIKYFESSEEEDEEGEDKEKEEGKKSEEGSEASGSEAADSSGEESSSEDDRRPAGRRKNTKKVAARGGRQEKALVQTTMKQYTGKRGGRQPSAA